MLTDPQDLPQQEAGSGKRGEMLVELAGLLVRPAACDLEQGALRPYTENKMAVTTRRKMGTWGGVFPPRAQDLG